MDTQEKGRIVEAHEPYRPGAWVWAGFLATFGLAEVVLGWSIIHQDYWMSIPLILLIAHLMHAHILAFHEASHGTLCPNRFWNEAIGLFIGSLSFTGLTAFRAVHHSHHAYLATERDEELWPFVLPAVPRWARRSVAALELTVGILYTPFLCWRVMLRPGSPIQGSRRRRAWAEFALMAVVWGGFLWAVRWAGLWKYLVLMYVIPGTVAGDMHSLRKYVEHMGLMGSSVLSSTRSIVAPGPMGRLIAFSLFNIQFHGIHHRYAKIPEARLPEFTALLNPSHSEELPPYSSYWRAFRDMIRSLADPRVGSQWRMAPQALANRHRHAEADCIAVAS